ncbi:50S ribosomal protein L30 [Candidatus Woesearchaeota archaeon]|nr:50S ribosomal protein L30 [Candidatus Woesearchaeota archaeon]
MTKVAIIRIKGKIGLKKEIKDTLNILRLFNKHTCVIIDNNQYYIGMLKKIKDVVTWGEIDQETFVLLFSRRGKIMGDKPLTEDYLKEKTNLDYAQFAKEFFSGSKQLKDIPGFKQFFRLRPPEKGFERAGIKLPYSLGGTLGYRKDKINDLIKRML